MKSCPFCRRRVKNDNLEFWFYNCPCNSALNTLNGNNVVYATKFINDTQVSISYSDNFIKINDKKYEFKTLKSLRQKLEQLLLFI